MLSKLIILATFLLPCIAWAQDDTNALPYSPPVVVYDNAPEYIGGYSALFKYIMDSTHFGFGKSYLTKEGLVMLKLCIDTNGRLKSIEGINGVSGAPYLMEESKRLLQAVPKWKAATLKGKAVQANLNVNILFTNQRKPSK